MLRTPPAPRSVRRRRAPATTPCAPPAPRRPAGRRQAAARRSDPSDVEPATDGGDVLGEQRVMIVRDAALDDRPPPLRRRRHLDVDAVRPLDRHRRRQPGDQVRPLPRRDDDLDDAPARRGRVEHRLQLVVGRCLGAQTTNSSPSGVAPTIATDDVQVPASASTTSVPSSGAATSGMPPTPRPAASPRRPRRPTGRAGSSGTRPRTRGAARRRADRRATARPRCQDSPAPTPPGRRSHSRRGRRARARPPTRRPAPGRAARPAPNRARRAPACRSPARATTSRLPAPCINADQTSGGTVCASSTSATVGFKPCSRSTCAGSGSSSPPFHAHSARRSPMT